MKKNILRISLLAIVIVLLLGNILPVCSMAVEVKELVENNNYSYSKAYENYLKLSDEEKEKIDTIPIMYNIPIKKSNLKKHYNVGNGTDALPTSYVLTKADVDGDKTVDVVADQYGNLNMQLKEQYPYDTCWAFTSINALETNLALHGNYANEDKNELYDFSELHLDWFGRTGYDENTGTISSESRDVHGGGNFFHFLFYIFNELGVVLEDELPYWVSDDDVNAHKDYLTNLFQRATVFDIYAGPSIDKTDPNNYTADIVDEEGNVIASDYQLNDTELTNIRNEIKTHIMTNGSLYAQIDSKQMIWSNGDPLYDGNYIVESSDSDSKVVLNGECKQYYVNGKWYEFPDHAITLIGWDDNYATTNFPESCRPSKPGAYIAMNSWADSLGKNNIFYISYEDYWVETGILGVNDSKIVDPLGIVVTQLPNKTTYVEGDTFKSAGMEVCKVTTDYETVPVTEYTYSTDPLTTDQSYVTISYTEGDWTFSYDVPITVVENSDNLQRGDWDKNNKLSLYDAFTILRIVITTPKADLAEMSFWDKYILDYSGDDVISLYDAFSLLRVVIAQ